MSTRPNILLITADHLRRDSFGVYGNRVIKTPHVDQLAVEGAIFDHHIIQNPVCMPSRWSIFTGRYPRNHGVRENGVQFKADELTLARVLREHGYATGAFGKMHLCPQLTAKESEDENWPEDDFGFQAKHLTDDSKRGEYLRDLKARNENLYEYVLQQGREKIKEDFASAAERTFELAPQIMENAIPPEFHQTSWVADQTIDFIDHYAGQPFFAWCSFVDPHHPYDPPEPYASMYDPQKIPLPPMQEHEHNDTPPHFDEMYRGYSPGNEKYEFFTISDLGWQTVRAKYYGMVSLIDANIGRMVDKLKAKGVFENTIIIVTADHGEMLGDHGLMFIGPFHYDGLIRVPLIMKWGDRICGGTRIQEISQHIDLMPTCLNYAGLTIPRGVQGRPLSSLIQGDSGAGYPYALVENHSHDWGFNVKTLRSKDWRLTYYGGQHFGELYDLKRDPHEFCNLWDAAEYRDVRENLKTALLDRLMATEDLKLIRHARY